MLSIDALLGVAKRVDTDVFARLSPDQKVRIRPALRAAGEVVGFMGDGVNDAPALKAADVGTLGGRRNQRGACGRRHDPAGIRSGRRGRRGGRRHADGPSPTSSNTFDGRQFEFRQHALNGGGLALPAFLPMLATQILLNNLLYDVSEIAIPFDHVDPEATARPVKWDIKMIERFMLVFGPLSSVFDFLTFYALLHLFGAGEALFQTGWFIKSITTQVLVVFAIRTRRRFFRSRPHKLLVAMALGSVAVAVVFPLLPAGR